MAQFDSGCNKYRYPYPHDKDEKKFYSRTYRPNDWASSTEYKSGTFADVVIPAVPNGWLYVCTSGGISGASEPTFGTVANGTTSDNSVVWTAKPYGLLLNTGDTISVSTWRMTSDDEWVTVTAYTTTDTVVPTTPNGYAYDCTTAGTAAVSEPTWPTTEDSTVTDGAAVWTARFIGTLDNPNIVSSIKTKFRLTAVPESATSVTVVNHITVTRANADEEEFDSSLVIKIKPL